MLMSILILMLNRSVNIIFSASNIASIALNLRSSIIPITNGSGISGTSAGGFDDDNVLSELEY